jgi:hypothetical protein
VSEGLSRRDWVKVVGAAGAGSFLPQPAVTPDNSPAIHALVSSSEVFVPPRGAAFNKFSFDFPEPSVEVAGFRFGFLVFTRENVYGLARNAMTAETTADGVVLRATEFVWAGGQERAKGRLEARFTIGDEIRWSVTVDMEQPVKTVTTIVRGVPRGSVSTGGGAVDRQDDELLYGYPFGAGDLFGGNTAAGINTPFLSIRKSETEWWSIASLDDRVRAKRFYLQPGESGYRLEAVFEAEGWNQRNRLVVPTWRLWKSESIDAAVTRHYQHLEVAYTLPAWERRPDAPDWLRKTGLVLALHGAHFTGFIFNDFERMRAILRWSAERFSADRTLVFLPAWDGRYYWNYPRYEADPRMGGPDGLKRLIDEGHQLGFRFMPMFGANCANRNHPEFARFADAATARIDGDKFDLTWVDWDNDRHQEGWVAYMNLGVASWRQWLTERIASVIQHYNADGYFLDISGGWINNPQADMHEGMRQLVGALRTRFPSVLACGEFHYDALLGVLPLFHVYSPRMQPYARSFEHLSHPAPGRGSSGVHEAGYGSFNSTTGSVRPGPIPTITVVDDTFTHRQREMELIIRRARELAGL